MEALIFSADLDTRDLLLTALSGADSLEAAHVQSFPASGGLRSNGLPAKTGSMLVVIDLDDRPDLGFEVIARMSGAAFQASGSSFCLMGSRELDALTAIRAGAVHFLLKPLSPTDIDEAVERATRRAHWASLALRCETLADLLVERQRAGERNRPLLLPDGATVHRVDRSSVAFVEASNKHTILHTDHGTVRLRVPFGQVADRLGEERFVRTHRSCLVSLDRITAITATALGSRVAILDSGARVPVSRQRLREVRRRLSHSGDPTDSSAHRPAPDRLR